MNALNGLSTLFETYRGHDQALSIIGYGSMMVSELRGVRRQPVSAKLKIISVQISNARTILRLLDDVTMLSYTLTYGLGKKVRWILIQTKILLTKSVD